MRSTGPNGHVGIERLDRRVLLAADLGWAIARGANGTDRGTALVVDGSGNAVAAGSFNGTVDFDPSAATKNITAPSYNSAFIAKYRSDQSLAWARALGGNGEQNIQGIAADGSENVIVAGYFSGTIDFDPGAGVSKLTADGEHDAFVVKLNSSGAFVWARQLGGASDGGCTALSVDSGGNVYAMGMFSGSGDYDPGASVKTLTSSGSYDVFLIKLSADGSFVYAVRVGGSGEDFANGVSVGSGSQPVIVGTFRNSVDFDPGPSSNLRSSVGGKDVFVLKLTSSGGYAFAKTLGGSSDDQAGDVRVDSSGNIVVVGQFAGMSDFDPSSATAKLSSAGGTDAFVAKLGSDGAYKWAHRVGGTKADRATDLSIDYSGNVHVTGQFAGTADFDPGSGVVSRTSSSGSSDIFALKLSSSGSYAWARTVGGSSSADVGEGIAVDNRGSVYVIGGFGGMIDFDSTAATYNRTASGSADFFLWKLING